ncbi:MAG: type I-B CRISPR-associated protein Cas5b [Thermoplasmataceae archaeon]
MSEEAVRLKCYSISSGFRTPLSHSIHDTLPLPPPTTIIGMIGAALGVDRKDMNSYYSSLKVGVIGTHEAIYQDLTHIIKFAGSGEIKNKSNPTSLLTRENLFNNNFLIWIMPDKREMVDILIRALQNPKYALSMGRDDEIIRIDEVKKVKLEYEETPVLENTILPFNLDPKSTEIMGSDKILVPLVSVNLPRSFLLENDGTTRKPTDFKNYTFIENHKIKINGVPENYKALRDERLIFYAL